MEATKNTRLSKDFKKSPKEFRARDKKKKHMSQVNEIYCSMIEPSYSGVSHGAVHLYNTRGRGYVAEKKDIVLMQYVGLKDKNGTKIFEGDIVGTYPILGSEVSKVVVEWRESGWVANGSLSVWQARGLEVVGNIFENSSLLQ